MGGRISFVHPARRGRVLATLIALSALSLPVASPLLSNGSAANAATNCVVNTRTGGTLVWDDYMRLVAGTDAVNHPGYSMLSAAADMGAGTFYANHDYGQGVDIAVIDTGVDPVQGLNHGNVIHGPDFSFDAKSKNLAHYDGNGHGTMMASIAAGSDFDYRSTSFNTATWGQFNGVAPGARIVSEKVGDATGAVDVSQVIAAIDWAVQHAHTDGLNIRVINLSYGVPALDDWTQDLLSYAVEQAEKNNILVVASAGNGGATKTNNGNEFYAYSWTGVLAPAFNQHVLAVGSYDTNGTPAPGDDSPASYSTSDTMKGARTPDLVAPGDHVIGLHPVGALMDSEIADDCAAATTAWTSPVFGPYNRFARGSGTSEAAALASGAAALMMSAKPSLTADQVKNILITTTTPMPNYSSTAVGTGELNLARAWTKLATPPAFTPTGTVLQGGTMDGARGGTTNSKYTFRNYVDTYDENGHPGACTDVWKAPSPTTAQINTYNLYCTLVPLQDPGYKSVQTGNVNYTVGSSNGTSIDIFGRTVNVATLQNAEPRAKAWTVVGAGEQWAGDSSFAIGHGFNPTRDPALGLVWNDGPAVWPPNWRGQPFVTNTTNSTSLPSWSTSQGQWVSNYTGYSFRGWSWRRFSFTGQDWSGYSFRDNAWS